MYSFPTGLLRDKLIYILQTRRRNLTIGSNLSFIQIAQLTSCLHSFSLSRRVSSAISQFTFFRPPGGTRRRNLTIGSNLSFILIAQFTSCLHSFSAISLILLLFL